MTKLSFKERQKQQREQEIIQAAGMLMREHGYDNLNMDMLAEEVGISKPTLYQHFSSKSDLVARVMLLSMESLETYLQMNTSGSALERLEIAFRHVMEKSCDRDHILGNVGPDLVKATFHAPIVVRQRAQVMHSIAELVEDAKNQRQISSAIRTDVIVQSMFALVGVIKRVVGEGGLQPDDISVAIESVITLFMSGIRQNDH